MSAIITFFPVDNGDMTLIRLADESETSLLIDCKIRAAADDPDDATTDVAKALRDRLGVDSFSRPFTDAMLLSHPDEDHCLGLEKHFWLGLLSEYPDDDKPQKDKRIVIRQIWSSPMVFRRASSRLTLCSDAKAFNKEARRRVKINRDNAFVVSDGDRILILGEDENGKTDDLGKILVKTGETFDGINKGSKDFLTSLLLAPIEKQDDDAAEEKLSKNNSSVVINFRIKNSSYSTSVSRLMTGGDAEVDIWERIWSANQASNLKYDLLQAPHHCSWHSLSHDSWSENGESAEVSQDARSALAQSNYGAFVVSSSKPVVDDENDPPCIRAKREYKSILGIAGLFKCTGEEPSKQNPAPLEFESTHSGFKVVFSGLSSAAAVVSVTPPRAGHGS